VLRGQGKNLEGKKEAGAKLEMTGEENSGDRGRTTMVERVGYRKQKKIRREQTRTKKGLQKNSQGKRIY